MKVMGQAGVAIIVEALTDNRNRTAKVICAIYLIGAAETLVPVDVWPGCLNVKGCLYWKRTKT